MPQIFGGGGGPRSQIFRGGVPCLRFWGGGSMSQIFGGGSHVSDFPGGGPMSQIFRGGPSLRFSGGFLVSVKGKIFDTRFGLIHVQTGKNFFVKGPPPPSKGKNF